jgi:hypothetical protein
MLFSAAENRSKRGMRGRWGLSDAQWRLIESDLRPLRRSRSAVTRHPGCTQWDFACVGLRRAVARTASEISAVPDRPPPLPGMGPSAQARACLARAGRRVTGARKARPRGGIHRRLLRGAKKGASRSGLPNAARGRKSLLSPIITVFLSLLVLKAPRRRKASSSKCPRAELPRHPPSATDRRQSLRQRPFGSCSCRALRQ